MKKLLLLSSVVLVAFAAAAFASEECENINCANSGFFDAKSCGCKCKAPWAGKSCRTCTRVCENGGEVQSSDCSCVCYGDWTGEFCEKSKSVLSAAPAAASPAVKAPVSLSTPELNENAVQAAMQSALTSPHCNGNLYITCKGETAKDSKGIFLVTEKMQCTRWSTAYRTIELLSIKGSSHSFRKGRNLFDAAQLNNLRNEATADENTPDTLVSEENIVGFMTCHAPEAELLAAPDSGGESSKVIVAGHCSGIYKRADLAREFINYILPAGDAAAADAALFNREMGISS